MLLQIEASFDSLFLFLILFPPALLFLCVYFKCSCRVPFGAVAEYNVSYPTESRSHTSLHEIERNIEGIGSLFASFDSAELILFLSAILDKGAYLWRKMEYNQEL